MDIDCNGYMAGTATFGSATAGNPDVDIPAGSFYMGGEGAGKIMMNCQFIK